MWGVLEHLMLAVNIGGAGLCGWTVRQQRKTNRLQAETAAMLAEREAAVLLREGHVGLVRTMRGR